MDAEAAGGTEPKTWSSPPLAQIWRDLCQARESLVQEVRGLSEGQLAFRPSAESWSIAEILDHLFLAEQSIGRVLSKILQQAAGRGLIGSPGSMALPALQLDLDAYNQAAVAPESVRPLPGRSLEPLLAALAESRDRLMQVARRADGQTVGTLTLRHFQLGDLNFYQWLALEGAHEEKHLQQIRRLRARPDFPAA
jgi:hypothetical protein